MGDQRERHAVSDRHMAPSTHTHIHLAHLQGSHLLALLSLSDLVCLPLLVLILASPS
jgi:hypothetical protein